MPIHMPGRTLIYGGVWCMMITAGKNGIGFLFPPLPLRPLVFFCVFVLIFNVLTWGAGAATSEMRCFGFAKP